MIFNAYGLDIPNKETLLRCTKVWENANPTLPLLAETVNLSADTNAIFYIVEYKLKYGTSGASRKCEIVFPQSNACLGANFYESSQGKFVWYTRNVTISGTTAVFNDDSVDGEAGEYIVPMVIYAIHN